LAYGEGKQFPAGQPLTGIRVDLTIDPKRQETYDWFFGTPQSGRLLLELFGSDAGQYAHKPVSVNGCALGDLPTARTNGRRKSLPLTSEGPRGNLRATNEVRIENSAPKDAFKVRRLRLEIVNAAGETWTTKIDDGPYTSCGWISPKARSAARL